MRFDLLIAIILALFAFAASVSVMVTPDYIPLPKTSLKYVFWIAVGISIALLFLSILLSIDASSQGKNVNGTHQVALAALCISLPMTIMATASFIWLDKKSRLAASAYSPEKAQLVFRSIRPNVDYTPGENVSGIKWKQGYSHIRLFISNVTKSSMSDLDVFIAPEKPIIAATLQADFATCRLGLADKLPAPLVIATGSDGKVVGMPAQPSEDSFIIGPPYRLICDRLPSQSSVVIDLATVDPNNDVMAEYSWSQDRHDPQWVDIRTSYVIEEIKKTNDFRLTLDKAPTRAKAPP